MTATAPDGGGDAAPEQTSSSLMLPVVALVGRPNVGKSTLFNALTRTRDALVADQPGVTRDRHYGTCRLGGPEFLLVDTGGLNEAKEGLDVLTEQQSRAAIDESDLVVFIVDARDGLVPQDSQIVRMLRQTGKPFLVCVNKTDGLDEYPAMAEFAGLGADMGPPLSAAHNRGVGALAELLHQRLAAMGKPALEPITELDPDVAPEIGPMRVTIVGRPNVGKSTLVNRLLGEQRVIASDVPGTTRDPITVKLNRDGVDYQLVDTAGVRRRARVEEAVEKFSVIKTLQSIQAAQVVVLMADATQGITDQDSTLLGHILDAGRALVIAVNKWDGLSVSEREHCKDMLDRKLGYVKFARRVTISALHGSGLAELMRAINEAHASAMTRLPANTLTKALEDAVQGYQPPLVRGRSAKLRYAHPGGHNPPRIIIHGSRVETLAPTYLRYLENFFRDRFKLVGTPVRFEFKSGDNPYKDKKNPLSDRQQKKRKRLIRHVKKR